MKLSSTTPILLAALALSSTTSVHGWSYGGPSRFYTLTRRPRTRNFRKVPGGGVVCGPNNRCGPSSPSREQVRQLIQEKQRDFLKRAVAARTTISPRYEITDNDALFQVAVDVPGVKLADLDVTLEEDGSVLSISGRRTSSNPPGAVDDDDEFYAQRPTFKFAQSFYLDPAVVVDQLSAKLENGVLIVSAPKDFKNTEENIRKIPIEAAAATTTSDLEEEVVVVDRKKEAADVEEASAPVSPAEASLESSQGVPTVTEPEASNAEGSSEPNDETPDDMNDDKEIETSTE